MDENEFNQAAAQSLMDNRKFTFLAEHLDAVDGLQGMLVEVGCYRGGTLLLLSARSGRRSVGFDTFEGLPDLLDADRGPCSHEKGDFADIEQDMIEQMAIRGIPVLKKRFPHGVLPMKVAFCHLDVDLYEGTYESLGYLADNLAPGGRVVVDDYGFIRTPGVAPAVEDFLKARPELELLGFGQWQVALRRKDA